MATQLMRGLYNIYPNCQGCVVTIGNFDGVHKGHQALIAKVRATARALGVPAVVVTFEPQPAEFFRRGDVVPRLTRWREKFHALARCEVDGVLVLRFNKSLADLSAADFLQQVLCTGLKARHVIVGDDFQFGKGRQGDFAFLQKKGAELGFTAEHIPSVKIDGERVSSTRVRQALQNDNVAIVEKLLGHPYYMEGRVVYGDKIGRELGFPTANILLHRQRSPVQGVYVVRMHGLGDTPLPGVANVGVRPAVGGTKCLLEVHLFDFDQDIYKRQVSVEFCKKLRDEENYESLALLAAQIQIDARQARDYFKI